MNLLLTAALYYDAVFCRELMATNGNRAGSQKKHCQGSVIPKMKLNYL